MQESAKKDIQESAEKDTWESADSAEEDIHEFWQPHLAEPHGGSRSFGGSNDGGADTAGGHDGGADQEPQSQDPKPPWHLLASLDAFDPPWPASLLLTRKPRLAEPHGGSRSSGGSNDGGADTAGGHDGGADPEPQSQDPKPPWPGLETMLPRPPPPRLPPPRLPELSYSYFCIQCHTKPSWNGEANEHCSTQCRDRAVQGV